MGLASDPDRAGRASASALAQARMLLKADQGEAGPGWTDAVIAGACSPSSTDTLAP
jgi:hypothetical protein